MSRVHDAMRNLEQRPALTPEREPGGALNNLVGALLEELADEVPDTPKLESVRADLLAASRTYETSKKKDLALRFYLATRSLLRENELLSDRLKRAEKRSMPVDAGNVEQHPPALEQPEGTVQARAYEATVG
jgi:hypothetical protein